MGINHSLENLVYRSARNNNCSVNLSGDSHAYGMALIYFEKWKMYGGARRGGEGEVNSLD